MLDPSKLGSDLVQLVQMVSKNWAAIEYIIRFEWLVFIHIVL